MIRAAVTLHNLALFAYPRSFRAHFGRELAEIFRRRLAAASARGGLRALTLAAWLITDALISGAAERVRAMRVGGARRDSHDDSPLTGRSRTMSVESLLADARIALRRLRHAPLFALITIATLALGIGASTAMFSVADAVLLRPLPYTEPDRLVAIWSNNTHQKEDHNPVSPANFDAFRREASAFDGVEATYSFLVNTQIDLPAGIETVPSTAVTPGLFDLLGRPALHGRVLRAGDDNGVLLSYGFWQRSFAADPKVVGQSIRIPGAPAPYQIVGVMPQDFVFPYKSMLGPSGFIRALSADVWQLIPAASGRWIDSAGQPARTVHYLTVIGRLKPDQDVAQAQAQLSTIANRRAQQFKDTNDGWSVTTLALHEQVVGRVRPAVVLLMAGVGLLLLMTCLNIANVLLARGTATHRDLAVRAALGASSGRLVQQALVESLMLAFFGTLAGSLVVVLGTRLIVSLAPSDLPRLAETSLNWTVLGFAVLLSGATGVAVGLLPAIASQRSRVGGLQESHRSTATAARRQVRAGLVVAEIAIATVLTVGTGLLVRSFVAIMRVDPGFDSARLLTFQQNVPPRITTPAGRITFLDDLSTRLSAIPGVKGVGGTTRIPLGSTQVTTQLRVEGHDIPTASLPEVDMRRSVGDYFQTMGIPVLQGRVFQPEDRTAANGYAIVNSALVRRIFKDEPVVGRHIKIGSSNDVPWLTIVGVVGDIRHSALEDAPRPEIYISHLQGPPVSPFMAIRVSGDPLAFVSSVRDAVRELGADPPYNVSTMEGLRSESVALRRFILLIAGLFGVLALVLAAVGVYGVMALVVAERTDEVGVRIALGATPARILAMIVGHALRLGLAGLALGAAASLVLAQAARNQLFGIGPTDFVTFAGVPLGLLLVALIAAMVPAMRATRISPVQAIRQ